LLKKLEKKKNLPGFGNLKGRKKRGKGEPRGVVNGLRLKKNWKEGGPNRRGHSLAWELGATKKKS